VATRPAGLTQLWGADATIAYPDDGAVPPPLSPFPAVGGWRYGVVVLPPRFDPRDAAAPPPDEAALGDPAVHTDAEPGMHWTETIDLEVVIRGEVVLELDDGAEKVLRTGDVIVQNGTRHRWLNRTDEPAVFVAFIVGAEHAGIG
jgi:hypothetical protein